MTARASRFAGVAIVLLVAGLVLLVVALPLVRIRMKDPVAECAVKFEERKAELVGARWTWLPPGWDCSFTAGPSGRLP